MIQNEIIFLSHIAIVSIFSSIALKLKKEALFSLICVQAILANIFVTKQVMLYGFCVTCTDIFTVGISLCLNFIQEFYDKKTAQKAIWISFFTLIFYVIMSQIHLIYNPASVDTYQQFFIPILSPMPRIIIASMIAYVISQYTDTTLYGYLKNIFKDKFFILRNYGSIIVSQLVDTIIFSFLGLYQLVDNIWDIFFISYAIKVISIIFIVPVANIIVKKLSIQKN